ncbi:hypothetical protein EV356DRAFT_217669 [Viridothelium virens]|uniref:Uncharacterized protein n=1 Tax=Viridothelium virens TaxID=1048519 RepID=A0A6A6H6P8_VIRVR|nr:hypothetical protein EV356DRAFT_217669 [Viridothelium virens]
MDMCATERLTLPICCLVVGITNSFQHHQISDSLRSRLYCNMNASVDINVINNLPIRSFSHRVQLILQHERKVNLSKHVADEKGHEPGWQCDVLNVC